MSFVELKNLKKTFGDIEVFEHLSATIEKGEFITLLGPSGCGKSTLLRAIAGLNDINEGAIIVNGVDITEKSPRKRNISMVFQSYALFPNMTVEENIAFGLKMKRLSKKEIEKKVNNIIEMVELEGRGKRYPSELSGGQQQRVALARALVVEPDILLLDEPLSALDAKIRKNLRLQIRKLQRELNITTIFVTHDQEEALIISDRIFLMDGGAFAQIGSPEEVYTKPKTEFVARFMGNYNVLSGDDIACLIGQSVKEGTYAIRPEGIALSDFLSEDKNNVKGILEDIIILGSVIRYHVRCEKNFVLTVDVLNGGSKNLIGVGEEVILHIPKSELKKVG